jgi:hypothetical protein
MEIHDWYKTPPGQCSTLSMDVLAVPVRFIIFFFLLLANSISQAQDIEPRSYSNAPVGMNFLVAALGYSEGGISFDPSVPITNADIKTDLAALAYARVLDLGGQSGKFDIVLPYASLKGTADYLGSPVAREISGYGDPRLRFSMNFLGAPALTVKEFAAYRQDLIIGGSVQLSIPTGQYDNSKLINIGTNRWYIKPELGASKAWGPWTLELMTGATLFGDNADFFGGKRREQDPIYSLQGHLIYGFSSGIWMALTTAYLRGGRTTLDGVRGNDLQESSRLGATLALPVDRHNSIKLYVNSGVYTRTGTDFDTIGAAWQYRWGDGF